MTDLETREAEVSSGGTVEPEVTEEPRNEELVPPGLKCSVCLSPQHVGGYTSSPLCPATPVSPWCLDRHDIVRQRSLVAVAGRKFFMRLFPKKTNHKRTKAITTTRKLPFIH